MLNLVSTQTEPVVLVMTRGTYRSDGPGLELELGSASPAPHGSSVEVGWASNRVRGFVARSQSPDRTGAADDSPALPGPAPNLPPAACVPSALRDSVSPYIKRRVEGSEAE